MPASRKDRSKLSRTELVAWLDRRVNYERFVPTAQTGGTFALGRMRRLLALIGSPHQAFPVVHVAGTKGKGSTVAMIAAILDHAGHRVGCYLSPHVHALEERISVCGRPITSAELVRAFAKVIPAVDAMDREAGRRGVRGLTWFEVVTAGAMVHFKQAGVDIAVLETGLGGRLDATNVSQPILSVITSISLDHMALLGSTISAIATEKAGIIKRGCPVISGALSLSARRVIAATAARRRAPLLQLNRDFRALYCDATPASAHALAAGVLELRFPNGGQTARPVRYRVGMPGRHQASNASLAVVAAHTLNSLGFHVPPEAIAAGLSNTILPARIETFGTQPLVIVDAAHNVASMKALLETLGHSLNSLRPRVLVFAASGDKQIEQMLAQATGCFDHVIVTRYATNPRAASPERLVAACKRAGLPAARVADSPSAALRAARSLATKKGIVCVAGSFFLAAEIRGN
ncbi:MAG: folylpolyglutamate synthase/dihydrofolate synthase family protein [Planctomycetota bacterium]